MLLLALGLVGCETKGFWLEIPSFADGEVGGVWLWRLSEESGRYERACRIDFTEFAVSDAGRETISYIQECDAGHAGVLLAADLQRDVVDTDTVSVPLWYMRWEDPGTYKVSSFTDEGESALSETTLEL